MIAFKTNWIARLTAAGLTAILLTPVAVFARICTCELSICISRLQTDSPDAGSGVCCSVSSRLRLKTASCCSDSYPTSAGCQELAPAVGSCGQSDSCNDEHGGHGCGSYESADAVLAPVQITSKIKLAMFSPSSVFTFTKNDFKSECLVGHSIERPPEPQNTKLAKLCRWLN
jgi:hypothetical protein